MKRLCDRDRPMIVTSPQRHIPPARYRLDRARWGGRTAPIPLIGGDVERITTGVRAGSPTESRLLSASPSALRRQHLFRRDTGGAMAHCSWNAASVALSPRDPPRSSLTNRAISCVTIISTRTKRFGFSRRQSTRAPSFTVTFQLTSRRSPTPGEAAALAAVILHDDASRSRVGRRHVPVRGRYARTLPSAKSGPILKRRTCFPSGSRK